jgi:hypothetical protein
LHEVSKNAPAGVANVSFSGGARPSAIGDQGRQAAEIANKRALEELMNPQGYSDLPAPEKFDPSKLPEATGVDAALGIGSAIGKGIETFQAQQQNAQNQSIIAEILRRARDEASGGLSTPPSQPQPTTVDLSGMVDPTKRPMNPADQSGGLIDPNYRPGRGF